MMRMVLVFLALLVTGSTHAGSYERFEAMYDSVWKPRTDDCICVELADFAFTCDRAEFVVESGYLYVLPSVGGQYFDCVFKGKGRLKMQPPTDIEKFSLDKHFGRDEIDFGFSKFRMLASHGFIDSSFGLERFSECDLPGEIRGYHKNSNRAAEKDDWNVYASVVSMLAGNAREFVWIDIETKKNRLAVSFDSYESESFKLYKRSKGYHGSYFEVVLSAFPFQHYESGLSDRHREPVRHIIPLKYNIDASIDEKAHLHCKATLDFVSEGDSLSSLYAIIFSKSEIDSIFDESGDSLFFSKMEDEPGFTLFFNQALERGDSSRLIFYYHSEDIISKSPSGEFYIGDQAFWYPVVEYLYPTMYDVSFTCPERLDLLSVGSKVADSLSSDLHYTRWITDSPEVFTSFNYGLFEVHTIEEPEIPTVIVYRGKSHSGFVFGKKMIERVAGDVVEALKFYQSLFGGVRFDTIRVTEIPYSYGQGMPGLIHLPWGTFQSEQPIWDAQFRAHEVAHQWWGHQVRWDSYHDQWMSEAISEFVAAWFVQVKNKYDNKYFEILDAWRKDVVQKGKTYRGGWSEGTEAGPVWLGYRLSSSKSEDYTSLVYSKGGYILHMLRCLMKDWPTGSDDRFIAMMRDFAQSYNGRVATTDDFQRMVEMHMGKSMDWFFEQWIYGTHVPRFDFKEQVREENGAFFVDCVVVQKEVPEDFKSVIPLKIDLGNDQSAILTVTAVGRETEVTLPKFPIKPKSIEFNFYKAVLAR